jgi:uracil phosphoribosyltransferase
MMITLIYFNTQAIADFNKKFIIVDPMLATGQSIVAVYINGERDAKKIHCGCNCCSRRYCLSEEHLPEHPSLVAA